MAACLQSRENGPACEAVAAEISNILDLPYVILTASGRGGLYLLLRALDPGDVVIPSYTCSAVAEAVFLAGRSLKRVEHARIDFNQQPDDIKSQLLPGDIYVATHQYGIACDAHAMKELCHENGAFIIEDVAAALGTKLNGRAAGTVGDACFGSFDTTKLINAPLKGGFIATSNKALYDKIKAIAAMEIVPMSLVRKWSLVAASFALVGLRNPLFYRLFHAVNFQLFGRPTAETGTLAAKPNSFYLNSFSEWQAIVVLPQLKQIESLIDRRQQNYDQLHAGLANSNTVTLPPARNGASWAPIRFPILAVDDKTKLYCAAVRAGIDLGHSFSHINSPASHKNAWAMADKVLNLPFDNLLSDNEIKRLVSFFG